MLPLLSILCSSGPFLWRRSELNFHFQKGSGSRSATQPVPGTDGENSPGSLAFVQPTAQEQCPCATTHTPRPLARCPLPPGLPRAQAAALPAGLRPLRQVSLLGPGVTGRCQGWGTDTRPPNPGILAFTSSPSSPYCCDL